MTLALLMPWFLCAALNADVSPNMNSEPPAFRRVCALSHSLWLVWIEIILVVVTLSSYLLMSPMTDGTYSYQSTSPVHELPFSTCRKVSENMDHTVMVFCAGLLYFGTGW